MDIEQRDTMLFYKYDPNDYTISGKRFFFSLPYNKLVEAISYGFIDTSWRYNNAPDIDTFLRFVKKWNRDYKFIGFADQTKVYITGIQSNKYTFGPKDDKLTEAELTDIQAFAQKYGANTFDKYSGKITWN